MALLCEVLPLLLLVVLVVVLVERGEEAFGDTLRGRRGVVTGGGDLW